MNASAQACVHNVCPEIGRRRWQTHVIFFVALALSGPTADVFAAVARLPFINVQQSSDASSATTAAKAIDGSTSTYSLTIDESGSWWQGQLGRAFSVDQVELVNRNVPNDVEMSGLTLHLYNVDDQVVYQTTLTNPGSGATLTLRVPSGTKARSVWIGLPAGQTNGAGNRRVGLAEVRLFGSPTFPYGPEPVVASTNSVRVWQSSEYGGYPASNALDGDPDSFTHTADLPDSFWMADFAAAVTLDRLEVVNRNSCCDNRLSGLVLRLFDDGSNSIASVTLPNPGLGGTWTYTPAAGTRARWLRIGLENGQKNGGGNYYVTLAEVHAWSGPTNLLASSASQPVPVTNNLASFKPSYMLRLDETVPPASRANDDNYSTETKTTVRTVDGYWEVDLGKTYALYGLRSIAAGGIGYRLTNATVRLYDENHESVHAQRVTGTPDAFDTDLNGPRFARYVRVGLEDKQRTDPAGGIEFYIGFREVEVFGRETNSIGINSFTASATQVQPGDTVTLTWTVEDVNRVELHPGMGSVGAVTSANGSGSINVRVTNSTEFVLIATNSAGIFSRAVTVKVGTHSLPVRISEFVAENKSSLDIGDQLDWIELRNMANTPVDLGGCWLSDNPLQPLKWKFPPVTLGPHGLLLVFASGYASPVDPAGYLHANFRLDKAGGSLLMTAPDSVTTLDSIIAYPELDADLAYGRDLEGNWKHLEPTPGAVNYAPAYAGWVKPVDWSHARGFHDFAFSLTLTNNSPDATILYSLDGSLPSRAWSNSLAINRTTAVRVQAVRPCCKPARVQTKTFIFVNDVITSPVMNTAITQDPNYAPRMRPGLLAIPSISICLPGQPEYEEKEGSFEVLWPQGGDQVQINCGISRFGNAWTKFAKRSFRMKCRNRYGDPRLNVPLFAGLDHGVLAKTSFDELDLRSGSQDMVERGFYMAGRFVEDAMLDMGSLNPHGRFVHVYLNGVYWGQYDCREMMVDRFLADYLGGGREDYVVVRGNDNVGDDFVIGTPDPPNLQPWEYTRSVRNSYGTVRTMLDVRHLIDFMLLWNYGNSESEFRCSGPILPGMGFKFWIADADGFLRTSALGLNRTSRTGPGGLFGALVSEGSPDFKALLADRIYRHFYNQGALTATANTARLAARMQEIHDSLLAECARWGYRSPASWESAAAEIRSTLFPTRTTQLLSYLKAAGLYPSFDPPVVNQYGGLVTNGFVPVLTSATGVIYYTVDGTDPRLPGGGISPQARVWTAGSLTVTNDLTLTVRVRTSTGQWSALAEPRYLLASRRAPASKDLFITEANYNPPGSDEFEYVELYNASTNLLDLSGVSLSNAVRFIFPAGYALPPGDFVMVVESAASFAARYQDPASAYYYPDLAVAGQWVGGLGNSGDRISLLAADGTELSSVPYHTGGDWPERADGQGSSLELRSLPAATNTDRQVRLFLTDGRNWGSSQRFNGSPGRFETVDRSVRISELLTNPGFGASWVELHNEGSAAVNLTGCSLTDDVDFPARWTFPSNFVLAPGEFRVISSSQLPFGFSALGGRAYVLQLAGTNVLRFMDSVDFPAADRDEPFGLYMRSDGALDFTEVRTGTPFATNALPRVGPVVISEILFATAPGRAQFIELANLTANPVPLYDPARPTNTWKLEGVGAFSFPAGTVIPPCGALLVTSTNEAEFRAQYGVSASIPVLGPWAGTLDQDGETLKLLRPGPPQPDGTTPWYRVDHVSYRTNTPWPLATAGVSLERIPAGAYGNDPANWRVTPLNGTPGTPAPDRAPIIGFSGITKIPQRVTLELLLSVADLDVPWQTVSLSPANLPPGSTFDPALRRFSWTPSSHQPPGQYLARFVATDDAQCGNQPGNLDLVIDVTPALSLTATLDAGQLELSFPALFGEHYLVEYCFDLAANDWRVLLDVPSSAADLVTVQDPTYGLAPVRFYRVRWLR